MANWTHYWQKETMLDPVGMASGPLDHTASSSFRDRGVSPGDRVYVISCYGGAFYVVGRLIVDRIVDQQTAARELPYDPWEAADHILTEPSTRSPQRSDVTLPMVEVQKLEFISSSGLKYPKFAANSLPDRQTFRGVREITDSTATTFDRALGLLV